MAQGEPVGSYRLTCSDITVQGDSLNANCAKLDGSRQRTTLNRLGACMNSITQDGDIGNIDGNLVCLPDLPKPDPQFVFPTSETTLNGWIYGADQTSIVRHAWGIWAGLTQVMGAVDGVPARAFETWATPSNMIFRSSQGGLQAAAANAVIQRPHLQLEVPRQFRNAKRLAPLMKAAAARATDGDTNIFVSVAYNPPAARHAIANRLFFQDTLDTYLARGYAEVPNFPVNSVTIKPVYKVVPQNPPGGIYTFPGWPGTPVPARTFPEQDWNACVYLDVKGTGPSGNSIDAGCKGRNPSNTFHLDDFIHQTVSAADAAYLTQQLAVTVSPGDHVILVGMHVTSREIKRWAWQTFWWSANADQPYAPSSAEIAALRPAPYLDAASRHYAMAVAYQMVAPAQPITGGKSVGESVIAYNPHLEAGFDPSTFQILRPINGQVVNKFGVQTNCMTCHNLAMYNPRTDYRVNEGANRETPYGSDYYMSISDPVFNGSLKLDFAWSILGSLQLDGSKAAVPKAGASAPAKAETGR
jgi:hypothetical protein